MSHYIFFIDTFWYILLDKKETDKWRHKICQYFTFNMGKFDTFVAVQVTDEGERE